MAVSRPFKVPSTVPQDLAIIMGFVDPHYKPALSLQKKELERGHKRKGSPNIVSRSVIDIDNDTSSNCTESEDEVEAEIAVSLRTEGTAIAKAISSPSSDGEDSESQSSSSESSTSETSFRPQRRTSQQPQPSVIDIDANEDGHPTTAAYLSTTHEIPSSAIPVPPLPDPSTLPQEAPELVGEIVTILPDSVTVRGGGLSTFSARERRDAVLNEGSLLLLGDRTPLGYVSETFGPTTLPHYLVRVKRSESTTTSASHSLTDDSLEPVQVQTGSNTETNPQSATPLNPPLMPSPNGYLDPTKIFVSCAVYHIPSLSTFVFPATLARLKGSDASNIHDEEIAEHEQDFSDDEVEAMHKRLRRGLDSRSASEAPVSSTLDGEDGDSMSITVDEASSLYGTSPYDLEDISSQYKARDHVPSSSRSDFLVPSSSLMNFEDAALQDALMLARNSRHRRHASISVSEVSSTAGPSRAHEQDHPHGRSRRGGRDRGKDRGRAERGRERNFRGQVRGRGYRRGPAVAPEIHNGEPMFSVNRKPSFSFEEYDPHMPRPPSPTSLAIARAIGQWADGTPFPYDSGATTTGSSIGADTHIAQTANEPQSRQPISYSPGPYGTQGYSDSTIALSQTFGYQPLRVGNFGIAPHINPRFAQALQLPNSAQGSSVNPQNGSLDTPIPYPRSEPSDRG